MKEQSAEQFLKEKLSEKIAEFGNGISDFHTKDLSYLLACLDDKDEKIKEQKSEIATLVERINYNAEIKLKKLLLEVMTKNNLTAEQRLYSIRSDWEKDSELIKVPIPFVK